jgi:peptide/nickel transport system permease protein
LTAYIVRRFLYAIPILIGVNLLTFVLFFIVNSPDDIARSQLGDRRVTAEAIDAWKTARGYHQPVIYNDEAFGTGKFTETIFFEKSLRLFVFDFGQSDSGRDIGYDISQRMWPSLAIAIPTLLVGVLLNITLALLIALFRATYIDVWGVVICVILLSVSSLF